MSVIEALSDEECYLAAIIQDISGVDLAEFCWVDEGSPNNLFRCYDYQVGWYRNDQKLQIDQCGRAVGKSVGIQLRSFAFAFNNPGQEMLITAPELVHLDPVTKYVEDRINEVRLSREMLYKKNGKTGFMHRPFEAKFINGSRIIGRIPQKDGKGVKGCVAAGTLVLTRAGMKPIEEVAVGDEVLTHLNRWRPVLANYRYENPDGYVVAGGGHRGLVTSDNHRMYGRRNRNPQRTRNLQSPAWVMVDDDELAERYYLGSPTQFPAEPGSEPFHPGLMWVIGRYVADGHLTFEKGTRGRIHIIVSERQLPDVQAHLEAAGLTPKARQRPHNGTYDVEFCDTALAKAVEENFGRHADGKRIPTWLLGASEDFRREFLDGYLSGDGHWDAKKRRWQAGTASRELAVGLRLLGQTLGYFASFSWVDVKPNAMCERPLRSWRVQLSESRRNVIVEDGIAWQKVRSVSPVADIPVVHDLTVEEDHSYLADGLISHNQHPRWLEMDEGQDYPQAGWVELTETLRFGDEGSRFRVHGVSRGIRDEYYKRTQSKDWYVHRITAMHRPDWTKEERISKAEIYGSRDHPDYRRNILGVHGDALSALFVLHRLMACVDDNENSDYNADEYYHVRINDEWLRDAGVPITELIQLPARHKDEHSKFWIGMDVGMTNHPTEILVIGERYRDIRKKDSSDNRTNMRLRVIARIHLERISAMDQLLVMDHLAQFYRPAGFGMDRTGLGLPIYQIALEGKDVSPYLHRSIKGYNFSEKIPVGLRAEEEAEEGQLSLEERKITANVLEYSSDKLRELVDRQVMLLPWDIDMLKEFQGQAYYLRKDSTNPYGRKEFNRGKFHALDAARMAVLAYAQEHIQQLLDDSEYKRDETMILGIEEYEFGIF